MVRISVQYEVGQAWSRAPWLGITRPGLSFCFYHFISHVICGKFHLSSFIKKRQIILVLLHTCVCGANYKELCRGKVLQRLENINMHGVIISDTNNNGLQLDYGSTQGNSNKRPHNTEEKNQTPTGRFLDPLSFSPQ